jgi:hypothetical protein
MGCNWGNSGCTDCSCDAGTSVAVKAVGAISEHV